MVGSPPPAPPPEVDVRTCSATGRQIRTVRAPPQPEPEEPEHEAELEPEEREDEDSLSATTVFCEICEMHVNGPTEWEVHKRGKRHKTKALEALLSLA